VDVIARTLCLAQLSLIHLAPPQLVRVAADAGFDAVLARLQRTSDGRGHDVLGDRAMIDATRRAVEQTGVRIWDTEVIRLRPDTPAGSFESLFEVSRELGASYVLTTVEDDERPRAVERFAELCALADTYALSCALEFMVFSQARTLDDAVAIVDAAGAPNASVLVDALHLFRSGGSVSEVAMLAARRPELFPYAQVCDAVDVRPAPDAATARQEAAYARLVPGAGALPLAELVAALPPGCALSVEAPPQDGDAVDPPTFAARCYASIRGVLDAG
jgi:sugar phosphate isomerase/epimerase